MKKTLAVLIFLPALQLCLPRSLRASEDEDAAKAAQARIESMREDIDCSAKKDGLFLDYLGGGAELKGPYKFRCAKGKETITAPAWLAGEVSSMTARELKPGRETLSEARLWQEPLNALYDFSELLRRTRPAADGGLDLPQKFLRGACTDSLVRLDRALADLRRAKLSGSFGGRGDLVFAGLEKSLGELDGLEKDFDTLGQVAFYERSAMVMNGAEKAFNALFSDVQSSAPADGSFSADYAVAPRLLEGGRAFTMALPAYELEDVKSGDRVDLLMTYDNPMGGGTKETITATIIQAAPVLSVTKPDGGQAQASVRLLLSPVQAQYAALAAVQARELRLTVRAAGDSEVRPMEAANFKKIIK
jgi:hypothetical protein